VPIHHQAITPLIAAHVNPMLAAPDAARPRPTIRHGIAFAAERRAAIQL
jgi:hypothetical protein